MSPWSIWVGEDGTHLLDMADVAFWRAHLSVQEPPPSQTSDPLVRALQLEGAGAEPVPALRLRLAGGSRLAVETAHAAERGVRRLQEEQQRRSAAETGTGTAPGRRPSVEHTPPEQLAALAAEARAAARRVLMQPRPLRVDPLPAREAGPGDWWSLGAVALHALTGKAPPRSADAYRLLDLLDRTAILSAHALGLLELLLETSPALRAGSTCGLGVQGLYRHPFLARIDWAAVRRAEHTPASVPGREEEKAAEELFRRSLASNAAGRWQDALRRPGGAGGRPSFDVSLLEAWRGPRWYPLAMRGELRGSGAPGMGGEGGEMPPVGDGVEVEVTDAELLYLHPRADSSALLAALPADLTSALQPLLSAARGPASTGQGKDEGGAVSAGASDVGDSATQAADGGDEGGVGGEAAPPSPSAGAEGDKDANDGDGGGGGAQEEEEGGSAQDAPLPTTEQLVEAVSPYVVAPPPRQFLVAGKGRSRDRRRGRKERARLAPPLQRPPALGLDTSDAGEGAQRPQRRPQRQRRARRRRRQAGPRQRRGDAGAEGGGERADSEGTVGGEDGRGRAGTVGEDGPEMTAAELQALGLGRGSPHEGRGSPAPSAGEGGDGGKDDGGGMKGLGAPPPRPQYEGQTLDAATRLAQHWRDEDDNEFLMTQAPRPFGVGAYGGQRLHADALAAVYEASGVAEEDVPELMRMPLAVAPTRRNPWPRAAPDAPRPVDVFPPTVESGEEGEA